MAKSPDKKRSYLPPGKTAKHQLDIKTGDGNISVGYQAGSIIEIPSRESFLKT
jgi:hypothetical protein